MRINQVNGISFLFTIGFLLLFSSSFLAYLAWEGPGYQGSAAALEAPVMPPALDSAPVLPPAPPPTTGDPAPSAGVLEAPAETSASAEEKRAEPESPKQEAPKASPTLDKPLEAPKAAKPVVVPVTPPAAPKPVQNVEKKPAREGVKASQTTPERKAKSSRKVRAKKPAREEREDITRVPPEWDWFSKPLRMEIHQGKVRILGESSETIAREEGASEERISSPIPVQEEQTPSVVPSAKSSEVLSSERSEVPENAPKYEAAESDRSERLAAALVRLQARHDRRDREAEEKALLLPSKGGETKHVPASLLRLMNALKALRTESLDAPVNETVQSEGMPLAVESEKEPENPQGSSADTLTLRLN